VATGTFGSVLTIATRTRLGPDSVLLPFGTAPQLSEGGRRIVKKIRRLAK